MIRQANQRELVSLDTAIVVDLALELLDRVMPYSLVIPDPEQ
jgi:hypothetical protein